jgi:hypothetical protein
MAKDIGRSRELYLVWHDADASKYDTADGDRKEQAAWDAMVEDIQDHGDDCRCLACQTYSRIHPVPED